VLLYRRSTGLYVYNKIDVCSMEEVDEIARRPHSIPISCYQKLNFDGLLARIWDMMVGFVYGGWVPALSRCVGGAVPRPPPQPSPALSTHCIAILA
jgi:hypothetical protein